MERLLFIILMELKLMKMMILKMKMLIIILESKMLMMILKLKILKILMMKLIKPKNKLGMLFYFQHQTIHQLNYKIHY